MKRLVPPLLLLIAGRATAEESTRHDFEVAVTASPLLDLSIPFVPGVELTNEWAAGQKFGIGFVGGFGSNAGLVWLGALQANGYFFGDFSSGLLMGAEYALHTLPAAGSLRSSTGLYVGGKYALDFGLTFMLHGGASWNFAQFDIGVGEIGPLVNVGIGWSI